MKFSLSRKFRVLCAFSLASSLSFAFFSAPAYASNTPQLDVATIIALANADRAANGVPALEEDTLLDQSAQMKADDMAQNGYFAHVSPAGVTPWHWFEAVNYYYFDAGENLAEGFSDDQTLNEAWMHSPTHRANILNSVYKRVGIGIAIGMYEGQRTIFVAEDFANPYTSSAQPALAQAPAAQTIAKAIPAAAPQVTIVPKKRATAKKSSVRRVAIRRAKAVAVLPKRNISSKLALAR